MKHVTKSYLVLSLIVLLAASCGPVTPVALPVKSSTPVLRTSEPVSPTLTQIATATPTSTSTPPRRAENYRLQPWSATDDYYSKLAEKFSQDFYVGFNADRHTYELVFQAEKILRDPSSDWQAVAWEIVTRNPKGIPLPGMRPDQDLLAFLMEDLLNNENVRPEELPIIVKSRIRTNWECYRAEIVETPSQRGSYLVVDNLFGDQRDGWIFYTGNCEGTAVYALRSVGDQYRVEKLRDWQALEITFAGYHLSIDMVGDVNNNGVPEVVITISYGASGTPPFIGENLEFYEWDASKGTFLSDHTEMFEVVCFDSESCEDEWRTEEANIQGVHPLIVKELYVTMYDDFLEISVCDHVVIEHTYLWKDGNFIEQKQTLLPPTDERIECQLSWALQVLNRKTDEIATAKEIILEALPDWPESMNEMWGSASKDYFRLRLGLVYDLTGDEEAALTLLQNVAEHPVNPEFDFVSQLASRYLDVRSSQGRVQACQEINLLQDELEYKIGNNVIFVPLKKIREAWGVGAPIWMYRIDNLCNDKDELEFLLRQAHSSQYKNVDEWLIKVGLKPVSVQSVYESTDLTVWLVSLPVQSLQLANNESGMLERVDQRQIWLFTRTPHGFEAAYVDDIGENASLSVDYLELERSDLLITIEPQDAYTTKRLFVFHVDFNGVVQSQLLDFYVDGFINHQTNEFVTITDAYGAEQNEIAVYRWNAELGRLDKRIIKFDFSKAEDEAERFLFQEHDFKQAILHINMFLVQAPPEPREILYCHYNDCTYYPDWYRPYMRYLLALAYELSGQTEPARDIYFALWQDYPTNTFGLAASHRLTPVTP